LTLFDIYLNAGEKAFLIQKNIGLERREREAMFRVKNA